MRGRRGRLAKLLSVPVLAVCGFALAATLAGVGLATTTSSTTSTTSTTTTTTTTTTTPPGAEGCTPGYWKNHTEDWQGGYSPGDIVGDVFEEAPDTVADLTLLQGLQAGGGQAKALTRHGIAALLNSVSSGVDYPRTEAQVIDMVNDAYASGDFEATKDVLAGFNELGAPGFCD